MVRLVILILIVAIGCWGWENFKPEDFSKESIEAKIKQEKTINTVEKTREKRRMEAEKIMDQF